MIVDARSHAAIRVASVPAAHPYVENLATARTPSAAMSGVVRLPDPLPEGATPGQWWPPVMLDGAWIDRNAADFDVMHIHFGTESYSADHLAGVVDELRAHGKPLVYTVHDLLNPQLAEQGTHARHLELLIGEAHALITLTHGAATEIATRWGREASVIPHPHLWPLDQVAPRGTTSKRIVLGTHLRDLRPNIDGVGTTTALIDAVRLLRARGVDAEARIHIRDRVRDPLADALIEGLVAEAAEILGSDAAVTLIRSSRFTEAELATTIADLDVSVLPYSFGTHSGWVELCFDLGVFVAGAPVGFVGEQHPGDFASFSPGDGATLAAAVADLLGRRRSRTGSRQRRELVRRRRAARRVALARIERAHTQVYAFVARPPLTTTAPAANPEEVRA